MAIDCCRHRLVKTGDERIVGLPGATVDRGSISGWKWPTCTSGVVFAELAELTLTNRISCVAISSVGNCDAAGGDRPPGERSRSPPRRRAAAAIASNREWDDEFSHESFTSGARSISASGASK